MYVNLNLMLVITRRRLHNVRVQYVSSIVWISLYYSYSFIISPIWPFILLKPPCGSQFVWRWRKLQFWHICFPPKEHFSISHTHTDIWTLILCDIWAISCLSILIYALKSIVSAAHYTRLPRIFYLWFKTIKKATTNP